MNLLSSENSSGVFSSTTSEISLVNADANRVYDDMLLDDFDSIDSPNSPSRSASEFKLPGHLIKIQEMQQVLKSKLDRTKEDIVAMCGKHKQMRQRDESLTEKKAREIATNRFFNDTDNKNRLRREEHETRIAKLREEQLILQENIFGSRKV